MSPSRLRLSLLLAAALLVVLVPSVALARSAKPKGKGRSAAADAWTWSKALNAAGRYDVTVKLKKVAGRRAGVDVLQVTGPDGKARQLDPAVLRAATARFTVAISTKKLTLRFVVRRGKPVVLRTTAAAEVTPTTSVSAKVAAPAKTTAASATTPLGAKAPAATPAPTTTAPSGATPATSRRLLFDDEFDGAAGGLPSGSAWDPQEERAGAPASCSPTPPARRT